MNSHNRIHYPTLVALLLLVGIGTAWPVAAQPRPAVPEIALPPHQATTLAVDTLWEPRSHWAQEGYGTERAATFASKGERLFEIHTPGTCAVWWRPLDQPVDIAAFPLVRLRLRGRGISADSQGFLVSLLLANRQDGTRKMRGVLAPEQVRDAKPGETCTVDLRTLGTFDSVLGIKVELWAAADVLPAVLAMRPIAFLADASQPAPERVPPVGKIQFVIHDPQGNPVSGCRVTVDYENLNAAVSATTDAAGRVALQPKAPFPNHTASLRAPGYLPLELMELDPKNPNQIRLVAAQILKGQLSLQGQPVPGVVHIDTKTPRATIARFPRSAYVAANSEGKWRAVVPASAMAWLVRVGANGARTVPCEFTEANELSRQLSTVDLFPGDHGDNWPAPTAAWLMREGDADAVVSMAGDVAEGKRWRPKAIAAFTAMILDDPEFATYYTLDLAWLASPPAESPYADQAVDDLLTVLRRAGTRPSRAAAHLCDLAGSSLPPALLRRLQTRMDAWAKAVGDVPDDGQDAKAALAAATTPSRTTARGGITFDPLAKPEDAGDAKEANPFSFGSRSKRSGAIQFGTPRRDASRSSAPTGRGGTFDLTSSRATTNQKAQLGDAPRTDVQTARLSPSAATKPASPTAFTIFLPSLIRSSSRGPTFPGSSRTTRGSTTLAMARQEPGSVRLPAGQAAAPASVSAPWQANRARHALELDFSSLAEDRNAAVETTIVRNRWEQIAGLVQQGKRTEARAEALSLASRLSTQNAILTYLPLLALTDTDLANADRNAVSACLDTIGKANPKATASAYAASMLHCYRRGDFTTAQELHTRYEKQFPGAKPRPALLLALSLCQIKRGKQQEAYAHLATIVNDFPATGEAPRAALLMGWIDLSQQRYPQARAHLEHLVRTYPTNRCAIKAKRVLEQIPEAKQ